MSREGLTKREIGWLLAQEARTAAQALKRGMEIKVRESLLPPGPGASVPLPGAPFGVPMIDGLSALDDAIGMLGELQSRTGARRRGRIDVASLLYELAPKATITLSAEGGSEVFAEEDELSRMLQMLLADAGYGPSSERAAPEIHVERVDDEVRITMELGPDAAPLDGLERRWLNRMATRFGGRIEVSGRSQALVLPADGVVKEAEMRALRQELAEAQELGEAYARELAGVLTSAESHAAHDTLEGDAWSVLLEVAPALTESLNREPGDLGLLRDTLRAIGEFRAAEGNASFDVAAALAPLGSRLPIQLTLLPGQRPFVGAAQGVTLLAELLALGALEVSGPGAPTMTFALRQSELELSVTCVGPLGRAAPGFAWQAARSLCQQRGGRSGVSHEARDDGQRWLFWVRVPEHSPQSAWPKSYRPES